MSASREVECPQCDGRGQTGLEDWHAECEVCYGLGAVPRCVSCGDGITGCVWSGGRCLDCHERNAYAFPCEVCGTWGACEHP